MATVAPNRLPTLALGYALILAITIAGFWDSFFSKPFDSDAAHFIHGVAATGWIVLLIVQSLLIRNRNARLHMAIGRWSPVIVVPLVDGCLSSITTLPDRCLRSAPPAFSCLVPTKPAIL